ncbi:peptidase C39 bacteriocin processing [Candidatus Bipolaricaulota bacterium]|nr:peptidase C39 bacteriocin processing [Candidatus Bipolaricaulota bacterium]
MTIERDPSRAPPFADSAAFFFTGWVHYPAGRRAFITSLAGTLGRRRWPPYLPTYYYGIPTTETEALELAEGFMQKMGLEPGPERGINALALKKTLEAKGIPTKGYRVKPEDLQDYFARGGLPVIAHLTKPQKHFVVAVGMVGDEIVLADPSWGRSIIPFTALVNERGYSGVVLVPIPPLELAQRAQEKQKEILEWAAFRLAALARLREALP